MLKNQLSSYKQGASVQKIKIADQQINKDLIFEGHLTREENQSRYKILHTDGNVDSSRFNVVTDRVIQNSYPTIDCRNELAAGQSTIT